MSAGTAYSKRYGAGFVDKPTLTTPIDSAFLNAVEAALLQLLGSAPTADGQVAQWDNVNTRYGPALLLNKNIDPAAAIDISKINTTGAITNAMIAGAAAISRSKLDFGSGLVNADIAAAAAIAASKLASYPSDATKALFGDGSWKAPTTIYKPTLLSFNTTVAEKDLFGTDTTGFQIPANVMGATGVLRVTFVADFVNNSGSNTTLAAKVRFGGTTLWDTTANLYTVGSSAVHRVLFGQFFIQNTATNAQSMGGHMGLGATAIAPTTGLGNFANGSNAAAGSTNNGMDFFGSSAPAAVDTTANQNLRVTITFGNSVSTIAIVSRVALIEVL